MDKERATLTALLLCCVDAQIQKDNRKKTVRIRARKYWVKPSLQHRPYFDLENKLLAHLLSDGEGHFKNFLRLNLNLFEKLHLMIKEKITKQENHMRETIFSKGRLATTLRFIGSGCTQKSLEYLTRISQCTISKFIPEVILAIHDSLKEEYLKVPKTEQEWKDVAEEFDKHIHFPHIVGAIDGKHIFIEAPHNSGSYFYNYKGKFSIVLLAMVDAKRNFIYVNVGYQGRISDGGVFKNSSLYKNLIGSKLSLPIEEPLPGRSIAVPYMIVGDDAFGLSNNILRRFSKKATLGATQKIFNYRLSHTRNIVERAFGRLVSRFRILKRDIDLKIETTENIVLACVSLHNFLNSEKIFCEINENVPNFNVRGSNRSSQTSQDIRNEFADYFMKEGAVNFQWKIL